VRDVWAAFGFVAVGVVGFVAWARRRNPLANADHALLLLEKWRLRPDEEADTCELFLSSFKQELFTGTRFMADVVNAYGDAQVAGADRALMARSLAGQARAYETFAHALAECVPHVTAIADRFSPTGTSAAVHQMLTLQALEYENQALRKYVVLARGARANRLETARDAVQARKRLRSIDSQRLATIIADGPAEPRLGALTAGEFEEPRTSARA
jgi:hypothetical protein